MTDDATKTKAGGSPLLSEELGPLPRPEWLAGAHTQAWRLETVLSWPTENARRYTAPLFTVDQVLAYATQERAAERERIAEMARSRPGWFASFADCDDFAERVLRGPNG